jgi:hypothetical protein
MAEPVDPKQDNPERSHLPPRPLPNTDGVGDLVSPTNGREGREAPTLTSKARWRPVVDAHCPTHANLIVTLAVGPQAEEIVSMTAPHMEDYARKCDAQFVVIRGRTQDWWGLEKFRVGRFAESHERTLFVDADVFIRPTAPNIFREVPPNHVGILNETDNANEIPVLKWRMTHFAESMYKDQGEAFGGLKCFNSGVVLCDRGTLAAWKPPVHPFTPTHTSEQVWIERNITAHRLPVFSLANYWNCQYWWTDFGARAPTAHFVHLAGAEHSLRVGFLRKLKGGDL